MTGFLDLIRSDLDCVDLKVEQTFKLRPGHLSKFAHIETESLQKYLYPALVLFTGRLFNYTGEKLVYLASVIQLIYLAAHIHFRIPDDNDQFSENIDPRDGARFPVLSGDYLYGKYFVGLCEGEILEFLSPLANIIAEMNYGALLRKKKSGQTVTDLNLLTTIVEKETALLMEGASKYASMLAGASPDEITKVAAFGRNLGMAYGILERNLGFPMAESYFAKAGEALEELPQSVAKDSLKEMLSKIHTGELVVPAKLTGSSMQQSENNHYGKTVSNQYLDEQEYVNSIFSVIAKKYDSINTVLSLNQDKYWRKFTVQQTRIMAGGHALDVCCGTGMISVELAKKVGESGKVTGLDFNEEMLDIARWNLKDSLYQKTIEYIRGNAMDLPFPDNSFECVTIGFGLRNVPDMKKVLGELVRVVKPGCPVVCLEFSKPSVPVFKQVYNFYFEKCIPFLGRLGVGKEGPFRYLHNSWKGFPHQKELQQEFSRQGLQDTTFYELTGGVVSVHVGVKPMESGVQSVAATKE